MAEATMGERWVENERAEVSAGRLWTGRAIAGLAALFFLFDAAMKFVQPKSVAEAFTLFSHTLFPVYFGVLVWGSLWLRDAKLRELVPLRSNR